MTLYVDTSALLKRYIEEPLSDQAERLLLSDPSWITARHTSVEVRRNLARLLDGESLREARRCFEEDWARMYVVELDEVTCEMACQLAEATGARSLDALHLAAARRLGVRELPFLTFDVRQARAARSLGMKVLGA